jgi:hypothetical protein
VDVHLKGQFPFCVGNVADILEGGLVGGVVHQDVDAAQLVDGFLYDGPATSALTIMKKRFSTREVHPRDRLDYWHSVACNSLVGPLTLECRQTFAAAEEVAKSQILDLIAVSLLNARGALRPCISSARSVALLNVRAVIESRLRTRASMPRAWPRLQGLSIRYATALLAEENTSIMRLVLAMRLGTLPTGAGGPVARQPDGERDRLWLGLFRHDALRTTL